MAAHFPDHARQCPGFRESDFEAIERAIFEIDGQARGLDEITRSAGTIRNGGDKIPDGARVMREAPTKQIALLGHCPEVGAVVSSFPNPLESAVVHPPVYRFRMLHDPTAGRPLQPGSIPLGIEYRIDESAAMRSIRD